MHIYHINFSKHTCLVPYLAGYLTDQELRKAEQYLLPEQTYQYIICRGLLRWILSKQLSCNPREVPISYGAYGKPFIDSLKGKQNLHFNISHCKGYALIALTKVGMVGIDIENMRFLKDLESLADSCLGEKEKDFVWKSRGLIRSWAFLSCWTRKEALVKGMGLGIDRDLKEYDLGNEKIQKFTNIQRGLPHTWNIRTLPVLEDQGGVLIVPKGVGRGGGPSYIAAIACSEQFSKIRHYESNFYLEKEMKLSYLGSF